MYLKKTFLKCILRLVINRNIYKKIYIFRHVHISNIHKIYVSGFKETVTKFLQNVFA